MPKFGKASRERLATCHEDLQALFNDIIETVDCSVICGHRGEEEQNEAFAKGNSQKEYPHGKHNGIPSRAIDVCPYPIDWNDRERFYYFAGYVLSQAQILKELGEISHNIRWGGNWRGFNNGVIDFSKNTFDDLPHFELI